MGGDALTPAMGRAFLALGAGLCLRYVFGLARRRRLLRAARRLMPEEDYLYFGDSANAPYGVKSPEAVQTHLAVKEAPIADTSRYDRLRRPEIDHA